MTFKGEAPFLEIALRLIDSIDLEKSKIKRDAGTIFFCGGTLDEKARQPKSLREAILRELPKRESFKGSRIILAEVAANKLAGSKFRNLLDLEEKIAAIVDMVLLIVERPGSICELGAFVKTGEIAKKLYVLISSEHNNEKSFIRTGPLDYFEQTEKKAGCILSFDWKDKDEYIEVENLILKDIIQAINECIISIPKARAFRSERLGDKIHLILSICHILRGARIGEIHKCLNRFASSVPDLRLAEREIQSYLSALEICGFVKPIDHGKAKFYVPKSQEMPLEVTYKTGTTASGTNTVRRLAEITTAIENQEPIRNRRFNGVQHDN